MRLPGWTLMHFYLGLPSSHTSPEFFVRLTYMHTCISLGEWFLLQPSRIGSYRCPVNGEGWVFLEGVESEKSALACDSPGETQLNHTCGLFNSLQRLQLGISKKVERMGTGLISYIIHFLKRLRVEVPRLLTFSPGFEIGSLDVWIEINQEFVDTKHAYGSYRGYLLYSLCYELQEHVFLCA